MYGGNQKSTNFPAVNLFERVRSLVGFSRARPRREAFLDEVMSDPIILQLIAADGLKESDVRRTIMRAQHGLSHR